MWGVSRGIICLSLFESSNSIVARELGQSDEKINEAVGENNLLDKSKGRGEIVFHFTNNYLCAFIGCILSTVTYGIKGHQIWLKTETSVSNKNRTPIQVDFHGKTYLLKVLCYLYRLRYCYTFH